MHDNNQLTQPGGNYDRTNAADYFETIDANIAAAQAALPSGGDCELAEWILTNRPLPSDLHEVLAYEGLRELIRERALTVGVTVRPEDEDTLARHAKEEIERYLSRGNS